jgi:hypothetical protein
MAKLQAKDIIIGGKYRVISTPERDKFFFIPDIGSVGECLWVKHQYELMCIAFGSTSTILHLTHLEDAEKKTTTIDDTFLVTLIQEQPEKTLRLIKGIAKLTKHSHFVNFLELGELPNYCKDRIRVEIDPKKTRVKPLDEVPLDDLVKAMENNVMNEPERNGTIRLTEKDGHVRYIALES